MKYKVTLKGVTYEVEVEHGEAMKMENEIPAPCDGVVKQLLVNKGAVVATGDTLLVI